MFLLDTNVLSAIMGREPVPAVAAWVSAQPEASLCTTAICLAEVLAGIEILPDGRRRRLLEATAKAIFEEDFDGRTLPFDSAAAAYFAEILAMRRRTGRPIATTDLMIAAVARAATAHVVTRDISGFIGCGLTLINPWDTRP